MVPTLLLIRPRKVPKDFAKAARWPGRVVISPRYCRWFCTDIAPPAEEEVVIVTSQHGVQALAAASARRVWPLWCVGPGSLNAARAAGFDKLHAGGGNAQTLLQRVCAAAPTVRWCICAVRMS